MADTDIYIVSGARTAIGTFGGSLAGVAPTDLGAIASKAAIERAGLSGEDVEHSVFGNVIHTEPKDMYISRVIAVNAGVPHKSPAMTLNRLCGSGLQAIISGAQLIRLGDAGTVLAGGAESMSRAIHAMPAVRSGQKMGNVSAIDMMLGALTDPFEGIHMGITAENIARDWQISRDDQDAFALTSHQRASAAIKAGHFKEQITPVTLKTRKGETQFVEDEHVRHDATIQDMQKLKPVFQKDGTVTAGNASGINDGAAAVVLMSGAAADRKGASPMARIVSYGHAGVRPDIMGIGPVDAVSQALERAQLNVADLDVIESNEAFAAQACAVAKDLGLPADRTNPNGGAVALGHPVGATGAILTIKTLYELKRTGGRYGLITMCIGGGQGIALIIENVN